MFKVFYANNPEAMLNPVEYAQTGTFEHKYQEVLPHQAKKMGAMTMQQMLGRFNDGIPEQYGIRSMSVGDVLETLTGDRYVVNHVGFTKVSSLAPKPTWTETRARFKASLQAKAH